MGHSTNRVHRVSIVTPVYQGEHTLEGLAKEVAALTAPVTTDSGITWQVIEWILVYDSGPDNSADVIAQLADTYEFVRPVWLSRNFGQHSATLAGMASSSGDWIVTLDEDGQHDPRDISAFLTQAMSTNAQLVYARPTNAPPHGPLRNASSRAVKRLFGSVVSGGTGVEFQSFRLILGELGRGVAAYSGAGVYLDIALSWVVARVASVDVAVRGEGAGRQSGYTLRRLMSHFWRLVLSSGTRGLRIVSIAGLVFGLGGLGYAIYVAILAVVGRGIPAGWPSLMIIVLVGTGAILLSLGIIAEYIGMAVNMAMGRPAYLIVSDPAAGPLGRRPGRDQL